MGVGFLNQALVAATLNDNHLCIAKLIKMGATNIDECIQLAKEKRMIKARVMLLLMKAALTGDKTILNNLTHGHMMEFGEKYPSSGFLNVKELHEIQFIQVVDEDKVSTLFPLEIAAQCGQHALHRRFLMLTRIDKEMKSIDWSQLCLSSLDVQQSLSATTISSWVKEFNLSSNRLSLVPPEFKSLCEVRNITLGGEGSIDLIIVRHCLGDLYVI